jgi:cyclophilin family peptidyl-prolyl cis-trans isomerase
MQSRILPAVLILVGVLVLLAGCSQAPNGAPSMTTPTTAPQAQMVRLETTMGNITIELRQDMPVTAGNFAKLAGQGYYNNTIFHRVIDGFMVQGGDPTGTGRGGPGYAIPDEFTRNNHNLRGTIAMANAGPNTGGSQFFINLVDNTFLDSKHPVFGKVIEGMDVVDRIGKVQTDANDRPVTPVKIAKATVVNS